ncbi:MAG TPA: NAD(P)-binding protein [Candidatus Acidoferrales bacterium]|nr:NAD(P)-binding protein [Candidatus Acidoferrales bacterium]
MAKQNNDKALGMGRSIHRRDFLNGVALTVGAGLLPSHFLAAAAFADEPQNSAGCYPPAKTGLRGSHPGSFEVAHALSDPSFWDTAGTPSDTGERYDLIVVGGGISGLSSAHFFRKSAGDHVRILILDNHDDFGGHAKRNEFSVGRHLLLGFGGTYSIESPAPYSAVARGLIEELGIDVASWKKVNDPRIYSSRGLHRGVFFDKETFGADRLVLDPRPSRFGDEEDFELSPAAVAKFMEQAPLSDAAKKDFVRLYSETKDYLPALSSDEKKAKLARVPYSEFLAKTVGVDPQVVRFFSAAPHPLFGVGTDAVSAQDAWGLGLPGFAGMALTPGAGPGMNRDAIPNKEADEYFFHFPDGNASIARLLVRKLISAAIPGKSADDVVTARADYARLDQSGSPVRIRLNSTVVRVEQDARPSGTAGVTVTYSSGGKLSIVRGAKCVLACWNFVIPFICPSIPDEQKEALSSEAKVPLVYTNVAITNWQPFVKLGVQYVYAPGSYHSFVGLDQSVSIGGYHCSQSPSDPVLIHMMRTPCSPGLPAREQHRIGRASLLSTSFEDFEREIRDQLVRMLAPGGFDPARDIAAITVNRWPHGYAYEYNSLFDRFWLEGATPPCVLARRPFGRIAIANADAGAYAYTDGAIDQAWRAVNDLQGA